MFSIKKQKHRVVTLTLVLRSSCVITNAPPVIASTCFGYHSQAHSLIFFEVCIDAHGLALTFFYHVGVSDAAFCCGSARAGGRHEVVMGRATVRGSVSAVWCLLALNGKCTG